MTPKEKTQIRIEYATKALIESLTHFNNLHPGMCITKKELIPHVARRAGWIIESNDKSIDYDDNCGVPSEKFYWNRWSDLCLRAAQQRKWIVWEPRLGVRLGSFQEYQDIPNSTLAKICQGLSDNAEDRAKVIFNQGGRTILVNIQIKQLEAGDILQSNDTGG